MLHLVFIKHVVGGNLTHTHTHTHTQTHLYTIQNIINLPYLSCCSSGEAGEGGEVEEEELELARGGSSSQAK